MRIELTHDLLAKRINETVSAQFRARAYAQRIIELKYSFFIHDAKLLLSEAELDLIKPYQNELRLNEKQAYFLQESIVAQDKKNKLAQLRNIFNFVTVVVIIALMFIIFQYQRSLKRHEQNKHLANLVINLLSEINEIKTNHSLQAAKIKADSIRWNFTSDPVLADFFKSNDSSIDSLKQNLMPIQQANTMMRREHIIYVIKGKVVDENQKGLAHVDIFWKGSMAKLFTDEVGYFEIILDESLLDTKLYETLVFGNTELGTFSINEMPNKLRNLQDKTTLDLDKIVLSSKN